MFSNNKVAEHINKKPPMRNCQDRQIDETIENWPHQQNDTFLRKADGTTPMFPTSIEACILIGASLSPYPG